MAAGRIDCAGDDAHFAGGFFGSVACGLVERNSLLSLEETALGCAFLGWIEETDRLVQSRAFIVGRTDCDGQ